MSNNVEAFRQAYRVKLAEAVERHPEEYAYSVESVPQVVEKMIVALARGSANVGPAVKAAARACGIKPTVKAIRDFLSATEATT